MAAAHEERMRRVPKVDRVAGHGELAAVRRRLGERVLVRLARAVVAEARAAARQGVEPPPLAHAVAEVRTRAERMLQTPVRRVINATGVVLHTNLGRAPLSAAAVRALCESAGGYASLEIDLGAGGRGPRGAFAEQALAELCQAEDALVVNNNAAAVLLALTALAQGRAVVVSRGELVEIGGGFRVPEVLARSGARLCEVGTTNRTTVDDYRKAIAASADVAAILRVHQGNFRQSGFVARPSLADLAALARERAVVLIEDLGGGALLDLALLAGMAGEPRVCDSIAAGADLCCFSCDKVLGGPQAGAVVGRADLVARLRRDPLARALRLGRLPLVALEATVASYLAGEPDALPVLRMLARPLAAVRARVEEWCRRLGEHGIAAAAVDLDARAGGGTLAEVPLPSVAAELAAEHVDELAARLRACVPPVLGRVHEGRLLLDGRTVLDGEDDALLAAVIGAVSA
jgi:L-seryl-tRNA(Ser) seleniumtransferase